MFKLLLSANRSPCKVRFRICERLHRLFVFRSPKGGVSYAKGAVCVRDFINSILILGYFKNWVFIIYASEIESRVPTIGFLLILNIKWEAYTMVPTVFGHAGFIMRIRTKRFVVAVETIYVGIQTFLYSLLLYSMIGFHWEAAKFLWFYYYVFMCFVYFTLYGMMLVALTPSYQIAAIVMSFFLSFWNLFSGFLIPRMQILIWWRWYYWGSPVAWTIYGLITSQVGEKMDLVHVPKHGDIPVKVYLKLFLGYDHDFLGYVALAHLGWVLLFFFVFVYGIKVLNFQRR